MGSTNEVVGNANIPPEENNMNDAVTEVLLEFQDWTGVEDMEESRRILDRYNWDLMAAVSGHMGLEPPGWEPGQSQNRTTDGSRGSSSRGSNNPVPPRNSRPGIIGWLWNLITKPVDFVFRLIWDFIGYGLQFLRAYPQRAVTNPVQDVVDFISDYENKYGTNHPVFYQGTYGQALSDAKKELKFLLVYLHCDDHIDTPKFCRDVMTCKDFQDFVRENMLFWACSVTKSEGYKTSQALRENTYPFLALIVLKNNKMTIVKRIEAEINPQEVLASLHQGVADNEAFLIAARQERLERSMTQTLRQQQDEAYFASLRADQEKERKRQEDLEKQKQEELEKLRKIEEENLRTENMKKLKMEAAQTMREEPSENHPDVIHTVIKLPSGERLQRRFLKTDSLKLLYQFVFSHQDAPNTFDIATNFPKRTLPCKPTDENPVPPTFAEADLRSKEMLFVYDLES